MTARATPPAYFTLRPSGRQAHEHPGNAVVDPQCVVPGGQPVDEQPAGRGDARDNLATRVDAQQLTRYRVSAARGDRRERGRPEARPVRDDVHGGRPDLDGPEWRSRRRTAKQIEAAPR